MAKIVGWTIYIMETSDGHNSTGMCRSLKKKVADINTGRGGPFFGKNTSRQPVKILFKEERLPFPEAYVKFSYLRKMNTILRKKLIETRKWPMGGPWKEYVRKRDPLVWM